MDLSFRRCLPLPSRPVLSGADAPTEGRMSNRVKRFSRLAVPVAVLAAGIFAAAVVNAQQCVDRAELVDRLTSEYAEAQKAVGLANNGQLVEVFTSADGSWTIVTTAPTGESCPVAAGERWSDRPVTAVAQLDWKF
jgi:hypothetical protein